MSPNINWHSQYALNLLIFSPLHNVISMKSALTINPANMEIWKIQK